MSLLSLPAQATTSTGPDEWLRADMQITASAKSDDPNMRLHNDSCSFQLWPDNQAVAQRLTMKLNEVYADAGNPAALYQAYQEARKLIEQCRWISPNVLAMVHMVSDDDELMIKVKLRSGERSLSVYFSDEIHIRQELRFGQPGFKWQDFSAPLEDQAQLSLSLRWLKGDVS